MKPNTIPATLLLTLACALVASMARAQNDSDFPHSLALGPADATSSGAGGSGEEETAREAELAKATVNPVAAVITVPIQNNWDFGIGPADAMKYTANVQPVIPLALDKDWNLIVRTIMPLIYAESPQPGGSDRNGLGDILQSFFLSPQKPVNGWILGAGPAMLYPTATDSALGAGKWAAGPTVVALRQEKGFTYGILANQIWTYAGWGNQEVNATFLQPMFGYTTKTLTTFLVNTETTYDWHAGRATVPLNFMATQLLKIGRQPLALQLGYRYYVEKPDGGPDWGLRFQITFLFPK